MPADGWVGRSLPRVEDARHLTGQGLFVDDLERPRMLHAAFTRSPFGAARIENISVGDALEIPGVEMVITASELDDVPGLRPVLHRDEFVAIEMPLLCGGRIHHAGDRKSKRLNSSHANISYAAFC